MHVTSKKIGILILAAVVTPLLASLYGIVLDEGMYSISSEYYTKFKFPEYGIGSSTPLREGLAYVGWTSTWWTGLIIGVVLGATGLIHKESRMLKAVSESIFLNFGIAFMIGVSGLAVGGVFLPHGAGMWNLPDGLHHPKDFIAVEFMHAFGYVGGIVGLAAGIIYQIRQKRRLLKSDNSPSGHHKVHGHGRLAA